jgi:CRP-like cAMP-binding protein
VLEEVAVLKEGQSFGELALITNKKRNATIVTKENTHFATITKSQYQKALGKAF